MSLAKQLSGYRSSLSESSDTHSAETASKKRKTPNQPQGNENDSVKDINMMNPVHTVHDREARQGDNCTLSSSEGATESANLPSSSKDSVTNKSNQDRIKGGISLVPSSILVFSCTVNATAKNDQYIIQGGPSSILMSSSNDSVTTTAIQEMPQGGITSDTSSNDSLNGTANQGQSEGMQVDNTAAPSSILLSSCNNFVNATVNKDQSVGMQVDVTSAPSSILLSSCNNFVNAAVNKDQSEGMQVDITSTPSSGNFKGQDAETFADDGLCTFPSSDEDGEGMEWEPALNPPAECDPDPKPRNKFENMQNDVFGSQELCVIEDGSSDKQFSSKPPGNRNTSSPKGSNAEMTMASSVEFISDSHEGNIPGPSLSAASSLVNKSEISIKKSQKSKKKGEKGMKKFKDTSLDDGHNVEDSSSRSEKIVSIFQPDPPPAGLNVFCNSGGSNALGSTDFPGMDDVLQVIIEEEENELDNVQCEARFRSEDVNVEEQYVDVNSPGDANCSEERNYDVIRSEKQVISSAKEQCESQDKTSDNVVGLPDEQDVLEDGSFNDVSNDFENIGSDEEGILLSEQHKLARDTHTAKMGAARDKGNEKQGCSSGSTRDTRKVENSRGLTRDQGRGKNQATDDRNSHKAGRSSLALTGKLNNVADLRSSVEITKDRNTEDSTCESSRQKNNKLPLYKRTSNTTAKPATPSTAKPRGKSAHRVDQVNVNKVELKDVGVQTQKSCRTFVKPKEEPPEDQSKAKFRSRRNIFGCDLQTLELLWNFKRE